MIQIVICTISTALHAVSQLDSNLAHCVISAFEKDFNLFAENIRRINCIFAEKL